MLRGRLGFPSLALLGEGMASIREESRGINIDSPAGQTSCRVSPCRRRKWAFGVAALLLALQWMAFMQASAWDASRMLAASQRMGERAVVATRALLALMARQSPRDELASVRAVNQFFNRQITFQEDQENWGRVDYWASPMEALARGAGDCEDYAIAKYVTLVALGVPHRKLRLVYVRAQLNGTVVPHMVMAYYATPRADPLVADNLQAELQPASARTDLAPVFSFNAEQFWQGVGSEAASTQGGPQDRLTRWRDVLIRAQEEGFL
jgi:predicted transglutaminase-like cysteine proteinase